MNPVRDRSICPVSSLVNAMLNASRHPGGLALLGLWLLSVLSACSGSGSKTNSVPSPEQQTVRSNARPIDAPMQVGHDRGASGGLPDIRYPCQSAPTNGDGSPASAPSATSARWKARASEGQVVETPCPDTRAVHVYPPDASPGDGSER
jgi:hypothetical protein